MTQARSVFPLRSTTGCFAKTLRVSILLALAVACTVTPSSTSAPLATPTGTPLASPTESLSAPTSLPLPTATALVPTESPISTPGSIAPLDPACCALAPVVSSLRKPTYLTHAGDERLFILEQPGLIRVVEGGQLLEQPFLDLQDVVGDVGSEQGLLSLAFHPDYVENGRFFVNYTDNNGDTIVAGYRVTADPNRADPGSEQRLLQIDQPFKNHNGGDIVFGPDGLLYIGMGDGGSAGDPQGNGQNPQALLGKLLRLNVDPEGAQPEIWALGLRNPWRFSFDRLTGDLFIGDVGQGQWEEIDYVSAPLPAQGPNFGWNILEGTHRYSTFGDVAGLTGPIAEYSHMEGYSVTGGYVYRGQALPALNGFYFFADYGSGAIWSLARNAQGAWDRAVFMKTDYNISSFGEDVNGELYLLNHRGGAVYQLVGK